jgi:rubrerythrin
MSTKPDATEPDAAKPSYLGLLNAIAIAEARAHEYLVVWADATPCEEVRKVLLTVAAREGEHGMSFARRSNELGYQVRTKPDTEPSKTQPSKEMEIVTSDCSDLEKMKALKLHKLFTGDKPDIFDNFFRDHSIDIRTGELLGRYIAEERDTARLLRSCYEQLKAAAKSASKAAA